MSLWACSCSQWAFTEGLLRSLINTGAAQLTRGQLQISLSPRWHNGKESSCQGKRCGRCGLTPGLGRSPGVGKGSPLQFFYLEVPWTEEAGDDSPWGWKGWIELSTGPTHTSLPYLTSESVSSLMTVCSVCL